MGNGVKAFAALTYVINGMPLIYNGQEVGFNRRLQFFEKDLISWVDNSEFTPFYQKLNQLKKSNSALAVGTKGADLVRVKTSNDVNVFAFTRSNEKDKVFAVFNLSALAQNVELVGNDYSGSYNDLFSDEKVEFSTDAKLTLAPWEFKIFVK